MITTDFGYTINVIRESYYTAKIILSNRNSDYYGVIDILELHKAPGFQPKYGESRKQVPIIHLHKGILQSAKDVTFNNVNLDNEYNDLAIWFTDGCGLSINVEDEIMVLFDKDGSRRTIEI